MTTTGVRKTLAGITIGLTIVETSEIAALGVNAAELYHMAEVIRQHLMSQGSEVACEPDTVCHARICIGGRTEAIDGYDLSIVEDALLMLEAGQPLYLAGVIGGASAQVISALRQAPMPKGFGSTDVWQRLKSIGVAGLARHNGLSDTENETLFKATNMSRIADIVSLGLARLRHAGHL